MAGTPYSEAAVRRWLGFIATRMKQRDQSIFLVENLQPDWLATRGQRRIYVFLSRTGTGLVAGYLLAIIYTLIYVLIYGGLGMECDPWLIYIGIYGLLFGLLIGIGAYLEEGLFSRRKSRPANTLLARGQHTLTRFVGYLAVYALLGSMVGIILFFEQDYEGGFLLEGLNIERSNECSDIWNGEPFGTLIEDMMSIASLSYGASVDFFLNGLVFGLYVGFFFATVAMLIWRSPLVLRRQERDIQTTERLVWSWKNAGKGFILGVMYSASFILFWMVTYYLHWVIQLGGSLNPKEFWEGWIALAPVFGLIAMMLYGFEASIEPGKSRPNQGILLTLKNAVRIAVVTFPVIALIGVAFFFLFLSGFDIESAFTGWSSDVAQLLLLTGLCVVFAIVVSLLVMCKYGLKDLIQHFTLRLLLWGSGYLPLNIVGVLDHATDDLVFMQRVGGGYIFIHRYLLEYFAASYAGEEATSTAG